MFIIMIPKLIFTTCHNEQISNSTGNGSEFKT